MHLVCPKAFFNSSKGPVTRCNFFRNLQCTDIYLLHRKLRTRDVTWCNSPCNLQLAIQAIALLVARKIAPDNFTCQWQIIFARTSTSEHISLAH